MKLLKPLRLISALLRSTVVTATVLTATATLVPASSYASTQGDDPTLSVAAAAAKHASYTFETWKQVVHKWRMLGKAGMRLVDLEVLEHDNDKRYYAGVWKPGSGKHALYRYSNWSAFVAKWQDLNTQGYRLIDIERVRHGNSFWYYGVWEGGNDKYALYSYNSWNAFTSKWSELNNQGYRLVDIDVTEHNNVTTYIGVWREGSGLYALYNYSSWSALVDKWKQLGPQGYQMLDMDIVHLSNGTTRYVGVWQAGSTKRALYRYSSWQSFKTKWAKLAEAGYALLDIEVVQRNATGVWYVGTYGPAPTSAADGPDLAKIADYLESTFSGTVTGMSYALAQHGQLGIAGSIGNAQRSPDPTIPMSSKIRSTVASVSKAITAPLLYKLLDLNNLSVHAPIYPWLPASWSKGPGFSGGKSVTFHQLLTHTSGLNQEFAALKKQGLSGPWHNDWDGLEFIVGNGTVPDSPRQYKNANFALMRVLIPALWKAAGGPVANITQANYGLTYLDYLHNLILDAEAIESITCWPQPGYPEAKSYNFTNLTLAGVSNSGTQDGCGGHANLHFSAQELTQYATAFRYDDSIMSPANRTIMRDDRAGWSSAAAVVDGIAYSHGGSWNISGGRKTRTCMMELPHDVNAAIIFNSLPPSGACSTLRQAYNAAF